MGNKRYKQGIYEVINKDKYKGDSKKVRYLSSWEQHVFKFFDMNPNIIHWNSEDVVIPYFSRADNRNRRYMVDLYVKYKNKNGDIIRELVEIKPFAQTQPPVKKKGKKKSTYLNEYYTFCVNMDKWSAASEYARKRKMTFRVITERDIFK